MMVRYTQGEYRHEAEYVSRVALFALTVLLFGVTQADAQSATDDPAQVDAGKAVFETNCAGCHGDDGAGSDLGRPLTGVAAQQPDRSVNVASVTNGKGDMPALGEHLAGEDIDAAVSYVRLTFVEATAEATELAHTGTETPALAIGGLTLLAAGALLVNHGRRETEVV